MGLLGSPASSGESCGGPFALLCFRQTSRRPPRMHFTDQEGGPCSILRDRKPTGVNLKRYMLYVAYEVMMCSSQLFNI
ncbi:hypothetical protein EXN66_Car005359 [Channa argus]|uniref:Uncharacterized protein n=1 Tax=Channa argus TaxID=215402 RepID=A0A6G1PHH3_CHAAH|nr:hypothetical protein EXN66_Car005359 [Channa argus]